MNLALPAVAHAQVFAEALSAGSLDPAFGVGGVVTTSIAGGQSNANSVVIQPDGKIVVAGNLTWPNGDKDFAIARYTNQGQLDDSFGVTGVVTTSIGITVDYASRVALQPDGKIIVVGYTKISPSMFDYDHDVVVARYTSTGAKDPTFGNQGVVTTTLGAGVDQASAVALQPDGKMVVAGMTSNSPSDYNIAVLRYTEAGALDTSFGVGGIITTSIGDIDYAKDVVVQTDGKIVVAGSCNLHNWAVVRYTAAGLLDPAFDSDGVICTQFVNGFNRAEGIALQPDGKLVVAGSAGYGTLIPTDAVLARYTTTGAYDLSFNGSGIVTTTIANNDDYAYDVAIQSDGKIVIGGQSRTSSHADILLARYTDTGTPDADFGNSGIVTTTIGSTYNVASGISLQADGKIVLAGYASGNGTNDFALARYYGAALVNLYLPLVMR